ncbi:MAG: hypothetical protein ACREX4_08550 [Gammaproteobacteria bacterium]
MPLLRNFQVFMRVNDFVIAVIAAGSDPIQLNHERDGCPHDQRQRPHQHEPQHSPCDPYEPQQPTPGALARVPNERADIERAQHHTVQVFHDSIITPLNSLLPWLRLARRLERVHALFLPNHKKGDRYAYTQ